MHARRAGAFTLVELLVVTGIVAILTAMLFPVFASARKSVQMTSCLSNSRQLSMAALMYIADHDDTFFFNLGPRFTPSVIADTLPRDDPSERSNRWDGAPVIPVLMPYIRNEGLWICPAVARSIPENGPGTNYQVNAFIAVNSIPGGGRPHAGPVTLADVVNPPRIKIWQDFWNRGLGTHRDGGNYACVDGHVKWQKSIPGGGGFIVARWWTP